MKGIIMNSKKFDYRPEQAEIEFDWLITNQCNFDCVYCYPQIKAQTKLPPLYQVESIEKIVDTFSKTGKIVHTIISGGEPFLYPNFIELSLELTKNHFMSIYTNFSTSSVYDFLNKVNPNKVANIFPALHVEQRTKTNAISTINDYVEKVLYAQKKGFNVHGIYVLHPSLMDRFENDLAIIKKAGVNSINIKVFKGIYNDISYPEGYSDEEKNKIYASIGEYPHTKSYLSNERFFIGKKCNAGVKFFRIAPDGTITRCASIPDYHGNIYNEGVISDKEPKSCTSKKVLALTNCMSYLVDKKHS